MPNQNLEQLMAAAALLRPMAVKPRVCGRSRDEPAGYGRGSGHAAHDARRGRNSLGSIKTTQSIMQMRARRYNVRLIMLDWHLAAGFSVNFAQGDRGGIVGRVTDSSHGVVAKATVTAKSLETGYTRELLKTRSLIERRRARDVGRACRRPADARILATVKSWLGSAVYQSVAGCLEPKLESLSNFVCFAGRPPHSKET